MSSLAASVNPTPYIQVVTVFGRVDQLADVVLDHPSISRQHATAAWDGGAGCWRVTDLGSTHGTFVGDKQLAKVGVVGSGLRKTGVTRRRRRVGRRVGNAADATAAGRLLVVHVVGGRSGRVGSVARCSMESPTVEPLGDRQWQRVTVVG